MKKLISIILILASCAGPLKVAHQAFDMGNYDQTIRTCRAIINADSTNADAYYLMGRAYLQKDLIDSSIVALRHAVQLSPEKSEFKQLLMNAFIEQGDQFFEKKEYRSTLNAYKDALKINKNPKALEKLADTYLALGWDDEALKTFRSIPFHGQDSLRVAQKILSIEQKTNKAKDLYDKGVKTLDKKQFEKAIAYFQQALVLKPDFQDARYALYMATGRRLYKKGTLSALWDAIEQFGLASSLRPHSGEPHFYMGLAYHKKDKEEYDNAIREFKTAAQVEPDGKYSSLALRKARALEAHREKMRKFWGK